MLGTRSILVTCLIALCCAGAQAAPTIGAPAPVFSGVDSNGKTHRLVDYRGKTVILEWTNHECPYVRKHYESGNMQALQKKTTAEGMIWLTIISSAPGKQGYVDGPEANELTEKRDASPTAVILDPTGKIGLAYAAKTTPHMFIIDPEGMLVFMGGIDDRPTANIADIEGATNYVSAALADLSAGRLVRADSTRPYGCSVKYPGS